MKGARFVCWPLAAILLVSCVLAYFLDGGAFDRTCLGLALNIVGTLVIAVYAIPQPDFSLGFGLKLELPEEEKKQKKEIARKKFWHMFCAYLGIGYLVVGFALQLYEQLFRSRAGV